MDKEYVNNACRKYRASVKGRVNLLYRLCKGRSEKRNLEFDLTKEWIKKKLDAGYCELSGEKFCLEASIETHWHPYSPSIDRIDSKKGYTQDNCRIILVSVNMGLGEWGLENYINIAKKVIKNLEL
jgi:hypothetical protein